MNTILDHEYTGPQFYTDAYEPLYPAFHSLPLLFAAAFGSLLLTRQRPLFQYPPRLLSTIIMLYSALHTAALPIANHPKRNNESLCVSPSWEQIVIFILVNYVTHAVTIKTYPGERKSEMAICIAAALLWPYTGAFKGFRAIWTGARFAGDPLQMALRAEALCVVARNPKDAEDLWSPEFSNETDEDLPECKRVEVVEPERVSLPTSGDPNMPVDINGNRYEWRSNPKTWKVHGHCHISKGLHLHRLTDETIVQLQGCWRYQDGVHPAAKVKIIGDGYNWRVNPNISKVHGQFYLPKGYHLHRLVDNERVEKESENDGIDISSSISTPKVIASLIQICASIVTLYRARGMQLELFGWGTFGLSVIPYALMSIVNLFGNLISPEYSAVYMVRSEVMDEAISRGGRFVGTVGVMQPIYRRIVNENERPQATAHPIARTTQATPSIPVACNWTNCGSPLYWLHMDFQQCSTLEAISCVYDSCLHWRSLFYRRICDGWTGNKQISTVCNNLDGERV